MDYERLQFGTEAAPGGLVRNSDGDYLHSEAGRQGLLKRDYLLMEWSTTASPVEVIDGLLDILPKVRWSTAKDSAILGLTSEKLGERDLLEDVGVQATDVSTEYEVAPGGDILDLPSKEAIEIVRSNASSVVIMNLGARSLDLTWHRPYARFVDSDREVAQAGIFIRDLKLFPAARMLARRTAAPRFFDQEDVEVRVTERGAQKKLKV